MEKGQQEEVSLEEERKTLFRQQAEQMLQKGKEEGLQPRKPDEQWIGEYVGVMERLHVLVTELYKDLASIPVTSIDFNSKCVTVAWSEQKSPTRNIGSVSVK